MRKIRWTKPYFGVTHIEDLIRGYQISMEMYEEKGTATISFIPLNLIGVVHSKEREVVCGTIEGMRELGEKWAIPYLESYMQNPVGQLR